MAQEQHLRAVADPDEVAPHLTKEQRKVTLDTLSETYLECRDLMHAWKVEQDFLIRDAGTRRKLGIVRRLLCCTRCETRREDLIWMKTFARLSSRYIYPDGYGVRGNHRGVVSKAEVRSEAYRRAVEAGRVTTE